jgi:hypothetical protein
MCCSLACQKAFGHAGVGGVGQGTGEPAEIFNSVVGPHGGVTQYMSPVNREAHLERVCRLYCRDVLEDLPARLWRMRERANAILSSARQRAQDLEAALAKEMGCAVDTVGACNSRASMTKFTSRPPARHPPSLRFLESTTPPPAPHPRPPFPLPARTVCRAGSGAPTATCGRA